MMIVGFTRLCSGELFGLGQGDANGLPTYSSVSQMGFLSLCVGAGVMARPALPTVIFYALHQALDKNALFLRVSARCSPGSRPRRWRSALPSPGGLQGVVPACGHHRRAIS